MPAMLEGGDASEHRNIKPIPLLEGMRVNIGTLAGTMVGRIGGGWLMPSDTVVGMVVVVIIKEKNGNNLLADGVGKFRSVF